MKLNINRLILLLTSIIIITSCIPEKHNPNYQDAIIIDYNNREQEIKNDLISSVKPIILKTKEHNFFLSEINKVILKDDLLLVSDSYSRLFVFDTAGNYLNQIGGLGKGPGEYLDLYDFDVDNEFVYLYSNQSSTINVYSRKDYLYINKLELTFYPLKIIKNKGGFLFYMGHFSENLENKHHYNILTLDNNLNVKSRKFPFKKANSRIDFAGTFVHGNKPNHYLFNPIFSDTVFSFNENKINPKYIINLPNPVPMEFRHADRFVQLPFEKLADYNHLSPYIGESDRHLLFYIMKDRYAFTTILYDKQYDKIYAHEELIEKEYLFKPITKILGKEGDQFIIGITPESIINTLGIDPIFEKQLMSSRYGIADSVILNINEDDNTVLFIVKFK